MLAAKTAVLAGLTIQAGILFLLYTIQSNNYYFNNPIRGLRSVIIHNKSAKSLHPSRRSSLESVELSIDCVKGSNKCNTLMGKHGVNIIVPLAEFGGQGPLNF